MKQFYLFTFILISLIGLFPKNVYPQNLMPTVVKGINDITELYPAEKPKISVERGFYKKPFDVVISTGVDGMKIYYTLDGSDPSTSKNVGILQSPAKIKIDPQNFQGRGKTPGVVLRARAKSNNYDFSPIATCTYLFIDKMDNQTSLPGHDWPNYDVNGQYIDLLMDSRVLTDPLYAAQIDDAFLQIPSISITTDNFNLFDKDSGIYVNAFGRGLDWERPSSIELINPDGSDGFQIDAGLRIRGGWSRHSDFRKHAFRLFFRTEYGESKLNFPLFGDEGSASFDKIDLRCAQNYSWSKGGGEASRCTFTRDVFSRDVQGKMNQEYTRSRYYHLYINGLYWGLYQTQERSEARFAADYMGGLPEDYDVVKRAGEGDQIEATDGNLDAWREIWTMCQKGFTANADYFKIQGLNEAGVRDPNLKVLLDVDNLIDYMNIIFYTGNYDAPVSAFMGNKGSNNFYAVYNRNDDRGFTFFAHDNEHTVLTDPINMSLGLKENRVNIGSISGGSKMEVTDFEKFHPQWLHFKLSQNAEYRQRFSDRSFKVYFNNGILTPKPTAEIWKYRSLQIDTAVIAESARWGDVDGFIRTKEDWTRAVDRELNGFFPFRTDIVIKQLQDEGLLSKINAPVFNISGNEIIEENIQLNAGAALEISNPNATGTISYTIDGSDPRLVNGVVSPTSVNGGKTTTISVLQTCIVKTRIFDNGAWSSLHSINLSVDSKPHGLQITEIHYNPLGTDGVLGGEYEFIELKNSGITPINLTTAAFIDGIKFNFNNETILEPGKFIVLASNSAAFNQRYGFLPFGEYEGQLDNKGENIRLVSAVGDTIITVSYNDKEPWPTSPDGLGFSLVPAVKTIAADWSYGINWRASSMLNGSPNADDGAIEIPKILINEILTNTDAPQTDAIELYNPNTSDVNIGGWYLSDNRSKPTKWKIPEGTVIPGNGYLVLNEGHYENNTLLFSPEEFGSSFSLSSHGEEIYLFSGTSAGELSGYESGFEFGAIETGVSFGRFINSLGKEQFVAQQTSSLNGVNGLPRVGPIVINQIMYNPAADQFEYLELLNTSSEKVNLYDETNNASWKVSGIDFVFPQNISIEPGQSVYLVEPEISPTDFKALFSLDASVQVFNYNGSLKNEGEEITLLKSYQSYFENDILNIPFICIDRVEYNNNGLWPEADGNGNILQKTYPLAYGNDPISWKATSPGLRIKTNTLGETIEGIYFSKQLTAVGGITPYTWSTAGDGLPEGLSLNPVSGVIDGTPTLTGTFIVNIRMEDAASAIKAVELSLHVQPNTLPVAISDTIKRSMDNSTIYASKNHSTSFPVLANDIDSDGDKPSWKVEISTQATHGTTIVNNDQTITYTPELNFMGSDSLTYRVTDLKGSSEAKLIIKEISDDIPVLYTYQFVNKSSDDAEENLSTKKVNLIHSTLEMAYDAKASASQLVGIRFENITLPEGAIISQAFLVFNSGKIESDPASLIIQGEASINPVTYTTTNLISSRPTTAASVVWTPESWDEIDYQSSTKVSSDVSPILNELIGMGWKSGNPIAFVIKGEGNRTAKSFNSGMWNAPVLYILYIDPKIATPTAAIANITTVQKDELVQLDGTTSSSSDFRQLNFYWTLVSKPTGSTAKISNPYSPKPSFIADQFGKYEVSLKVDNGTKESEPFSISIQAENQQPFANAGSDQNRSNGSLIHLNGSGSKDADGDAISYQWEWIEKPSGSTAKLSSDSEANPIFTADLEGKYILSLTVSDQFSSSLADLVEINIIANQPPLANAGSDIESVTGLIILLDGTKSSDPEEDQLTYDWEIISKPNGSIMTFANSSISKPIIQPDVSGEYLIQLTVSDGISTSTIDEVLVTAVNNLPPVAMAGNDQSTTEHLTIILDGSKSYDPDGKPLLYQWSFVTKPLGSNASIFSANTAKPSIKPDTEGLYTIKLRISDGTFTNEDQVQITADNSVGIEFQENEKGLNVYPNPFTENLVVDYATPTTQRVEFSLINISGAVIKRFEFNSSGKCTQTLNFENENLRSGMYLLMMKPENGKSHTVKVVHQ
jgi:hypothetical protein